MWADGTARNLLIGGIAVGEFFPGPLKAHLKRLGTAFRHQLTGVHAAVPGDGVLVSACLTPVKERLFRGDGIIPVNLKFFWLLGQSGPTRHHVLPQFDQTAVHQMDILFWR